MDDLEVDLFSPKFGEVSNEVKLAVCKFVVDVVNKLRFIGGSSSMFKPRDTGGGVGLSA